eukprot:gnl/Chilomastix_cuspidata/2266.p1 GENE.gnl/Chilomastix_cuspidata/2266~~gnl/Chilomastix_cuspidata/2266.p1  ORF type:complete len:444 (-),score=135.49 gnl/Chilomastix_cuspidata/2266:42-1319(-)
MSVQPGIIAIELFFPKLQLPLAALERIDGASSGKYTIGLGQESMSVPTCADDSVSLALNVVRNLLTRNSIDKKLIGRIDVGTESHVDSSKSIKSFLAQLFDGCTHAEGADHVNACYGATAAFFAALDWMASPAYQPAADGAGSLALVVASDLAEYRGAARATGGGGAAAFLIGPRGRIVLDGWVRGTVTEHVHDFCKPFADGLPRVDGQLSLECYIRALREALRAFQTRAARVGVRADFASFDAAAFHTPFVRMAEKAVCAAAEAAEGRVPALRELSALTREERMRPVLAKAAASLVIPRRVGNCYAASWMVALASALLHSAALPERVFVFSYGSGFVASAFCLRVLGEVPIGSTDLDARLEASDELFAAAEASREEVRQYVSAADSSRSAPFAANFSDSRALWSGAYRLASISPTGVRTYVLNE